MTPENSFEPSFKLELVESVHQIGSEWNLLTWTKKAPREVKNEHRAFWGMKPLTGPLNRWELALV